MLLVAQRSLEEALASGATTALADFNRRLREHFEGVLVLETGEAIPLWKVAIPTAAAPAIGELLGVVALRKRRSTRVLPLRGWSTSRIFTDALLVSPEAVA